jgi:hypothetical protein
MDIATAMRDSNPSRSKVLLSSPQFPVRLSYPVGTRGDSPGVKRPVRESDHSLSSSVEVKDGGPAPPLSRTSSWHST